MGRRLTAAQIQRRATLAQARETYLKNKAASTTTTVQKRPIDTYIYNSYLIKEANGTSVQMRVQASAAAVTLFGGATALGLTDPATVNASVSKKAKEFTPAQVHAMKGSATPSASVSPWGTRVIKYSTATNATSQAHYVAPVSGDTTSGWTEVEQRAGAIHTAIKTNLGSEDYYRFWISPEMFNVQKN